MPSTPTKRTSWPRIRLDPSIPEGWPEGLRDWLETQATDEALTARAREIYLDISRDPRLAEGARTLLSLESELQPPHPPLDDSTVRRLLALPTRKRLAAYEDIVRLRVCAAEEPASLLVIPFLQMAVVLAERAEYLDKLPSRVESLKSLGRAAQALLEQLPLERNAAWLYLSETNSKDRRSTRNALTRYNELVAALTDIHLGASSGRDISDMHYFLHPSRTRVTRDSVKRYFLRGLVQNSMYLFKRPLYKIAGIFATVCLRLPKEVTAKEAQELSRPVR